MNRDQIITSLAQHGIVEGRCIAGSKTGYCQRFPQRFIVFNSQLFSRRGKILKQVDLDLTLDGAKLTAAARAVGENLYVLGEHRPSLGQQPKSRPMVPVLRDALWWTRIHPQDQDVFLPIDSWRRPELADLECTVGRWRGQPAYSLDVWQNEKWHNQNMSGAVVEITGQPPPHLRVAEGVNRKEEFTIEPSRTRGRRVRPVFYQKSGLLDYLWFSHFVAVPSVLYDNSVGLWDNLTFTCHAGCAAIHVRQAGKVIGLVWPCSIFAPDVIASARAQLMKTFRRSPRK